MQAKQEGKLPATFRLLNVQLADDERFGLSAFLKSHIGQKVLTGLLLSAPSCSIKNPEMGYQAGMVRGYQECLSCLCEMSFPPEIATDLVNQAGIFGDHFSSDPDVAGDQ